MTANNYACANNLWAHCGALSDALRRASEAERRYDVLLKSVTDRHLMERGALHEREREERLLAARAAELAASTPCHESPAPPQLSGCPKCGSDASTVRGLRKEETEAGLRVCSRCFTRYEK